MAKSTAKSAARRRVCFLTAARSEYDILFPVVKAAMADARFAPDLVVCGAHLSPFHGMGIEQIRADGLPVGGTIETLLASESPAGRSLSFANLAEGLTRYLAGNRPDLLFVVGDREEPLAAAVVGNLMNIPIAHLHGGDRTLAVTVDEVLRHAISKLSHLHFTATAEHKERLIKLGESAERIWVTGAPGLDRLRTAPDVSNAALAKTYGIDPAEPFFLLIFHPSPLGGSRDEGRDFAAVLEGVLALGHPVICSYPNFDPGNMAIRHEIDVARGKGLIVSHNLPRNDFVALYRRCSAIVGNSSSIVIESGFMKVPGILVGDRQSLRAIGPNVLRVVVDAKSISAACKKALEDGEFKRLVQSTQGIYGDGYAAERIVSILAQAELGNPLLRKTLPY